MEADPASCGAAGDHGVCASASNQAKRSKACFVLKKEALSPRRQILAGLLTVRLPQNNPTVEHAQTFSFSNDLHLKRTVGPPRPLFSSKLQTSPSTDLPSLSRSTQVHNDRRKQLAHFHYRGFRCLKISPAGQHRSHGQECLLFCTCAQGPLLNSLTVVKCT